FRLFTDDGGPPVVESKPPAVRVPLAMVAEPSGAAHKLGGRPGVGREPQNLTPGHGTRKAPLLWTKKRRPNRVFANPLPALIYLERVMGVEPTTTALATPEAGDTTEKP